MRRFLFLAPLLAFALLAAYLGYGLTRDPSKLPSTMIDQPVPAFALPGVDGTPNALSNEHLTGQVMIVNMFASWCVPCRVEHPLLMRLAQEKGITLHGFAWKDKPEDVAKFLAELGSPYARVGLDESGRAAIDWGVYGVPETYIIDASGRIRYKHVGPLMPNDVEETILPLLERLGS
jgi:cytochrome c biogenesis protein CcmG/thiol:disulfide interchange protein DsbE